MLVLVYSLGVFGVLCWAESEVICSLSRSVAQSPFPCGSSVALAGQLWAQVSRNVLGWIQAAKRSFNTECGTWCFCQHVAKGFPYSQACMILFLKLEGSGGFWMPWELLSVPGRVAPRPAREAWLKAEEWRVPPSPSSDFNILFPAVSFFHLFLLRSPSRHFLLNNLLLDFGFLFLDALSLWTSELLQRWKILSLDSCSFGRYCICRKIARKHSRFCVL